MENRIMRAFKRAAISAICGGIEKKTLRAFRRAAKSIPAYKKILAERGVRPNEIKTINDFSQKVPLLYKADLFGKFSAGDLCVPGSIDSLASAIVTSGTSGSFAYKVITKKEMDLEKQLIDASLNMFFNASKIKTCVINVNPMGVTFVSSYPIIPTSVRSDIAWHVIKNFSESFEQIIIIGDPNFIKKLIEEGEKTNFENVAEKLKFVIGADWSPVSYFEYLKNTIPSEFFGNFGTTEIGWSIAFSDDSLHKLRKKIQSSKELQKDIFGIELKTAPELLLFDPTKTYIEKIKRDLSFSELAFTTLSETSMPFIRYATGDCGTILDTTTVNKILSEKGNCQLAIKLPLPILALSGRASNQAINKNMALSAEDIKQMLYSEYEIAQNITGDFRVYPFESFFKIDVQLKENVKAPDLYELIKKTASDFFKENISVDIYKYSDFPYNMVLDYESKWAYTKTMKKQ